jgi:hypothetical protein
MEGGMSEGRNLPLLVFADEVTGFMTYETEVDRDGNAKVVVPGVDYK